MRKLTVAPLLLALSALGCSGGAKGELAGASGAKDPGFYDESARQCPSGETLVGVDVSYYQGKVDWPEVRAAGVSFAFVRASDGATFLDPEFNNNWPGTRAAGVTRGAYQFFRPAQDPIEQANVLIAAIQGAGGLSRGDIAPVLDVEVTDGVAQNVVLQRAEVWLRAVEATFGRRPLIYTAPGFWDDLGATESFGRYPLWVANWASCPRLPGSWQRWTFWQTTDKGVVPGIEGQVDLNRFNGGTQALLAMTGAPGAEPKGKIAPAPAPPSGPKPSPKAPPKRRAKGPKPADGVGVLIDLANSLSPF